VVTFSQTSNKQQQNSTSQPTNDAKWPQQIKQETTILGAAKLK